MDNHETFQYSYSSQQQDEIKAIRKQYLPPEEDKLAQLRRLHAATYRKAQARSIALGVIGALVLGGGMSLCLVAQAQLLGIPVGLAGMVLTALAYPVYTRTLEKERRRIAPEILRLTDELLEN